MVGALALYEEWWAYLLAIAFVVLQHGAMGALHGDMVFAHAHDPWRWAGDPRRSSSPRWRSRT